MNKEESELYNDVYREIAGVAGLEAAIAVFRMFKGQQITFPVHLYSAQKIKESIISEFDGSNIKELAKKYDYSEKTVRRMIKESGKE